MSGGTEGEDDGWLMELWCALVLGVFVVLVLFIPSSLSVRVRLLYILRLISTSENIIITPITIAATIAPAL